MADEENDYFDENDELYEDDEDDSGSFSIRDRLKAPSAVLFTTRQLHTLIHEGAIDLNPPYQRDVVWPEAKQMRLLDSIYRNFYVPPIVFATVEDEEGTPVLRCVDGKQRLTSIQRFFDGQIPYKDPRTKKSYWYVVPETVKTKLEVPQYWKEDFASKNMTCIQYEDLASGLERDIFQRVQLGIPLSSAEKLQAIASPWSEWITELDRRMLTSDTGIGSKILIDLSRGRDFQLLAQLVCCCERIPSRTSTLQLDDFLQRSTEPPTSFKKEIDELLRTYWNFTDDDHLNMAFRRIDKRVAPVEFVYIGVLLYATRGCDNRERAVAAFDMRKAVREEFKDVRNNADVHRFLWNFIANRADVMEAGVFIEEAQGLPVKKRSSTKKRSLANDGEAAYSSTRAKPSQAKRPRGRPRKNPA